MGGNLSPLSAATIATWPTPNYLNPTQRTWYAAYASVLLAVTTILIGLRFWMRITNRAGHFGLDDWLLIPAYLGGVIFTVCAIMSNEGYQSDRHVWDVEPKNYRQIILLGWIAEVAYLVSTNCTKVSVLLFYRRLAHGSFAKGWRYLVLAAIVFTVASALAFILLLIFNCSPTYAYWEQYSLGWLTGTETHNFTCVDTRVLNPLSGAISVFSDFYAVLLPCLMTWNLDTPLRQRMALYGVFSVGLLVVGAGIARTYYLDQLGHATDLTWTVFDVLIWTGLEVQLAIICACAPSLRVLFRKYFNQPLSRAVNSMKSSSAHRDSNLPNLHLGPNHVKSNATRLPTPDILRISWGDRKSPLETDVVELAECEKGFGKDRTPENSTIRTPEDYEVANRQVVERARRLSRGTYQEYRLSISPMSSPVSEWNPRH